MPSVRKVTLRNGQTRYRVDYYDLEGKRRKERFRTQRESEVRLGEILQQRETGELRPRALDITFKELVDQFALSRYPEIRENTVNDYRYLLEKYLLPALGARKLRTISRANVEALRGTIRDKALKGIAKSGVRTTNKCLTLLKAIFNYAVLHGHMVRNPAKGVKDLPMPANERRKRVDGAVLTPTELQTLFKHCSPRWQTRIMTAALTGLRSGELLALTWDDIDWLQERLHVRQSLLQGKKLQEPKTPYALRTVPLPSQLIAELKRWRTVCPASDWNLVFPTPEGHPESPSNLLNRGLTPALRRAGLRKIRMHDLRHSYASLLIDAGEPLLIVSRILGHSSINITADTYGHLMPDIVAGVGQRLGDRVFGNPMDKTGNFLGTSEDFAPGSAEDSAQVPDLFGGPSAARTRDQRIKRLNIKYSFIIESVTCGTCPSLVTRY